MIIRDLRDAPRKAYKCLYVDPAWAYRNWSGADVLPQRAEVQHYPTMSHDAMKAMPVAEIAAEDSVLLMWITAENLLNGLDLAKTWGFEYKSKAFTWVKVTQDTDTEGPLDAMRTVIGMGKWTRYESEDCYLFTRGSPSRLSAAVRQVIHDQRREHSRKPDAARDSVRALVAGPRIELFSRHTIKGWDSWGLDAGQFDGG